MLTIEIGFPAGRYHATPWGRHVNEGVPEWPPSPYRFLRALIGAWKWKLPDLDEDQVERLLDALSTEPPRFLLPRAGASHTRSFLPTNSKNINDRKLIFDAFVSVLPWEFVLIGWTGVELEEGDEALLENLLGSLNYLGRSESWVTAKVLKGNRDVFWNSFPADAVGGAFDAEELEEVRVACPTPKEVYEASPAMAIPLGKKRGKASPVRWLDALMWGTGEILSAKRSDPPAMITVGYMRSRRCFDVAPRRRLAVREPVAQGVLYALESRVLPSVTETLSIAERVRRKLMGIHKRLVGDPSAVSRKFSGKDGEGRPMNVHTHLYYLPFDQDGDGRLDHLLVVGREPLDRWERVALDGLSSLWQSNGRPDIRCIPVQWGSRETLTSAGTVLRSVTPFVPPRHYRKGRGSFEEWLASEIRRESVNHGLPEPVSVRPIAHLNVRGSRKRWIEFQRSRKDDESKIGFGFEIEYPVPVPGRISLGYGAHFGLGQFQA